MLSDDYYNWAVNREIIRKLKEQGSPWPWTADQILRNNSFCNVSRRDDRTTKFIKAAILDPFVDHPEFIKIVALGRFLNLPSSLLALTNSGAIQDWNPEQIVEVINDRAEQGEKNWSPAYMVRSETHKESAVYGKGKIAYVMWILEQLDVHSIDMSSRQRFVETLNQGYGFSDFMSGQVAADISYTKRGEGWADNHTWAPQGPGAIRGMNRCLGRDPNARLGTEEYLHWGAVAFERIQREVCPHVDFHDVASNVFCETDKYLRYKERGKGGRRYHHVL